MRPLADETPGPTVTVGRRPLWLTEPLPTPDAVLDRRELRSVVDRAVATLTAKEAEIIRGYYGLDSDNSERTLDELGARFGLCRQRVKQIRDQALRKLRHPVRGKELGAYVGLYSNEDYAAFESARRTAERAAEEARWSDPKHVERCDKLWAARRAHEEALRAAEHARRAKKILRSLGDMTGSFDAATCKLVKTSVGDTLARALTSPSYRLETQDDCRDYFWQNYQNSAQRLDILFAYMRDVTVYVLPITITHAFLPNGSFMAYARTDDRRAWYLCTFPDGMHWIGFVNSAVR